jgi:hypothetical protein
LGAKPAERRPSLDEIQTNLRSAGSEMLETLEVSYVYGGAKVGDAGTCQICNQCLERQRPTPKDRFKDCPSCGGCSLDCSHFTQIVYERAGLGYPYLTTAQMLNLTAPELERRYGLVVISSSGHDAIVGDLLVYKGHVVIVESIHDARTADVIHATGGKDLKGPGQGIQRERFVKIDHFRGELRRVLRHKRVESVNRSGRRGKPALDAKLDLSRLRPVEKR